MNRAVLFETAKKLKEAGFPQPQYEFGQLWYFVHKEGKEGEYELLVADYWHEEKRFCNLVDSEGYSRRATDGTGEWIFAPTFTDIFQTIENQYIKFSKARNGYLVSHDVSGGYGREYTYYIGLSPHEAAAIAWLAICEK